MTWQGFQRLVERRRSVRRFTPAPVDDDSLGRILEAGRLAPSAGNLQAYRMVVVRDARKLDKLAAAAFDQGFVAQAPVAIGFVAAGSVSARRYGRRGRDLYAVQDATIAATFAMLAIEALGLATTWVGAFDPGAVAAVLGCAEDETPVAILPVGHAAEEPAPTMRKPLGELVRES